MAKTTADGKSILEKDLKPIEVEFGGEHFPSWWQLASLTINHHKKGEGKMGIGGGWQQRLFGVDKEIFKNEMRAVVNYREGDGSPVLGEIPIEAISSVEKYDLAEHGLKPPKDDRLGQKFNDCGWIIKCKPDSKKRDYVLCSNTDRDRDIAVVVMNRMMKYPVSTSPDIRLKGTNADRGDGPDSDKLVAP